MEKWSYKRNGAVEGPVGAEQLAALYEAGEITGRTLVRSTTAGGGWRRYEEIADPRHLRPARRSLRAVIKLWPWFVVLPPLAGGAIDVFLVQSKGNAFVASQAWLGHLPIVLNIAAILLWLYLIWRDIRRADRSSGFGEMVPWLVVAPVFQAFSWWATAFVSMSINLAWSLEIPQCDADVAQALVKAQYERIEAKRGHAGVRAVALVGAQQQWQNDRARMCTGKLETTAQPSRVRYKIEDRGNWLFRNTMHGLSVTTSVE